MATRTCPRGTWTPDGLLRSMTDAQFADRVDNSPPIGEAYAALGRIGRPTAAACGYAAVFGIKSRISGVTRGDSPADGGSRTRL